MFYKGSGGLKSMSFEAISAAQKSEEKHVYFQSPGILNTKTTLGQAAHVVEGR